VTASTQAPLTLTLSGVEFVSAGGNTTLTLGPEAIDALIAALEPHFRAQTAASPFMTIKQAADYIRAPRHRIDALLSQRKLPRHKEGRRTLIRRDELDAYLASH
jgi:excisionase family DNA binding protein